LEITEIQGDKEMENNDKQEPSANQKMVDTASPEKIKDEVAGTVTGNEEIEEERLIIDGPLNGQSTEKCTEEELGKTENVSISNDDILQNITNLSSKIDSLNQLFSEKIQHMEHKGKIIDQVHKELQKYKDDIYSHVLRQVLLDIIEVRNSILRITDFYLKKPEGEQDIPNETFAGYALDIQDILEKNDVEIYESSPGDSFLPVKQRVIKKIVTGNSELHGKVAESLSCGYGYNGRTISAEKIAVYYYEESAQIMAKNNMEKVQNG
jgi:molecular chaperone GrpE (heat shock protein)